MAPTNEPPAPTNLSLKSIGCEAVKVGWQHPSAAGGCIVSKYKICLQYFKVNPSTHKLVKIADVHDEVEATKATIAEFDHPPESKTEHGLLACTVKGSVQSIYIPEGKEGGERKEGGIAIKQISWDDQSCEALKHETERWSSALLAGPCGDFRRKRSAGELRVLVVGQQHHGKSSFVNHLYRCLHGETDVADQAATSGATTMENTYHTKSFEITHGDFCGLFIDTPAFSNLAGEQRGHFKSLLATNVAEGSRREDLASSTGGIPADAAIVVVSLTQWVSSKDELTEYLRGISKELKNASEGRVSFPYVVAVTHRDEFLLTCQGDRPHDTMAALAQEIGEAANAERVRVITSYKEQSPWSSAVNEETFRLLRDLVTLAANEDTGRVTRSWFRSIGSVLAAACRARPPPPASYH